ncbi:MAG: chemotaxis protein CheW [Pseudomonadota bacterium]|jgi:purine-binding chemotaxis protein CheW|uniref:chemotaxis protein CheW n=1 Tax=Rhizorhabdus phycosphaerae TaxID=2711156 RepID=UPI0013ECD464|nr:chemotaxis protein CheW [Rhizorhabdus phycosphaerae]
MSRQFITFQIGEQYLGVDIMAIREIRAWTPTTMLPHVPSHVRGVVNLRGTVLPVIDLAARLGWGLTDPTARHVIIVVRINDQLQGLIVDAVNDIVTIDESALQPPPSLSDNEASECLDGIASVEDRMVMILALDRLSIEVPVGQIAEAA